MPIVNGKHLPYPPKDKDMKKKMKMKAVKRALKKKKQQYQIKHPSNMGLNYLDTTQ